VYVYEVLKYNIYRERKKKVSAILYFRYSRHIEEIFLFIKILKVTLTLK